MSAHRTEDSYKTELYEIRKALDITQTEWAGYLGLCKDTVCRYETGRNITPEPIMRLARLVYRQLGASQRK
jgi:DNA-binding transcriptional regulator YiaG